MMRKSYFVCDCCGKQIETSYFEMERTITVSESNGSFIRSDGTLGDVEFCGLKCLKKWSLGLDISK